MNREPLWRRYLRFWGQDPEADIRDEFTFHLEAKIDELVAGGMGHAEARQEAERQFGPVRGVQRECYRISKRRQDRVTLAEYFDGWWRDLHYSSRVLRRHKASTAVAVLIFAVGIGATTALFTLLDRLVYSPLPVRVPSELVFVSTTAAAPTYEAFLQMREATQAFSSLAAIGSYGVSERRDRDKIAEPADGLAVSGNFFETLGTHAIAGRTLSSADDSRAGASFVAVISYRFWTRRYNRASDAVGGTIYLRNLPFTIVGVLSREFYGVSKGLDPDVYVPLGTVRQLHGLKESEASSVQVEPIGRLKPGITLQQAQSNLQTIWDRYLGDSATTGTLAERRRKQLLNSRIACKDASRGYSGARGESGRSLNLLAGIVVVLMLMGCANVACLLIARGVARHREIATRLSLGAGTARILRQSLLESCLLAIGGGIAGLAASYWLQQLLLVAFNWQNRPIDVSPDWRTFTFGLSVSLLTGLLCGLAPATQLLRGGHLALNQERTVIRIGSGKALVVVQVALSLVMVAGAAVFLRSYQNLRSVPLGFSAEGVSVILLSDIDPESSEAPLRPSLRLAESLRRVPGIEGATVADLAAFSGGSISYPVRISESPLEAPVQSRVLLVGRSYFGTMRTRLLAGRGITDRDNETSPKVAVLGQSLARRLFSTQSPLGRRVRLTERYEAEVVGVAEDIKYGTVKQAPPNLIYLSVFHGPPGGGRSGMATLQVRSRFSPGDVAALVREQIRVERLRAAVYSSSALADDIGASYRQDRIRMLATSIFGLLALSIITAGIYGLMAYSVARRTREIGVRMAVGSTSARIVRLVLAESSRLLLLGILIGVPGALAVMKALSGMVFGLSPVDGVSVAVAVLILAGVGVAASAGPALRASRLDPVRALRME
jgi:predicted permease